MMASSEQNDAISAVANSWILDSWHQNAQAARPFQAKLRFQDFEIGDSIQF